VGIVLDASVIIAAEGRGHTVRETLEQVKPAQSEIKVGVSFTTINNALRVLTRRVKAFSYGIFQ
jgi:predicted nucleotidyltransferase